MKSASGIKSIALFGGSFDPVHLGHLKMLEHSLNNFDFDELHVIPAQISPFKEENLFSAEQRLKFLRAVCDHERVRINSLELDREGPSYTSLTIQSYKEEYPDAKLYFILGTDNLKSLSSWQDFDYLSDNLTFIIYKRREYGLDNLTELGIKYHLVEDFDFYVSSSQIKEELKAMKANEIEANRSFDGLIPEAIQGLILEYYLQNL